jgi:hypothetical protein
LYANHSGTDTTNPSKATRFAVQRIAFPFSRGMNSRTTAPASGRNRIRESRYGTSGKFVTDYLTSR